MGTYLRVTVRHLPYGHPIQVNVPRFNLSQAARMIYLPRKDKKLRWPKYTESVRS